MNSRLEIEGSMLKYLAQNSSLPVPEVFHTDNQLLIMEYLPGKSAFSQNAQENAAELLANLHSINAPSFGF